MTDRPLFQARRTTHGGPSREVVNQDGTRVAFIPALVNTPQILDHRAGIIAAALTHDAISSEDVTISMTSNLVSVSDGAMRLADFEYSTSDEATVRSLSRDLAVARAHAFTDGYLVARRLCLGERT